VSEGIFTALKTYLLLPSSISGIPIKAPDPKWKRYDAKIKKQAQEAGVSCKGYKRNRRAENEKIRERL
jgi:hypothetical protein